MALEEIFDLNADIVTKLEKKGQTVTGYYLGSKSNKTKFGINQLHVFRNDKGNEGLWGSSQLDAKLARVVPGAMTSIAFMGKDTLENGMSLKQYKVSSDRANTIDVSSIVSDADTSGTDIESEDSYSDDEGTNDEVDSTPKTGGNKGSFGKEHAKSVGNLLAKK